MKSFQEFAEEREPFETEQYIRFKAHQEGVDYSEAASRSLSRLVTQLDSARNTIVVLTAFRSENPKAINRQLNSQLANDLRGLGWGYTPVLGGFVEEVVDEKGQPIKQRVHEESFFVNAPGTTQEVVAKVVGLLTKYRQEAALVKPTESQEGFLLFPNGSLESVGRWKNDPQQMAIFYTRLRKGSQGRQFTFEAAGDASIITRQAVAAFLKTESV